MFRRRHDVVRCLHYLSVLMRTHCGRTGIRRRLKYFALPWTDATVLLLRLITTCVIEKYLNVRNITQLFTYCNMEKIPIRIITLFSACREKLKNVVLRLLRDKSHTRRRRGATWTHERTRDKSPQPGHCRQKIKMMSKSCCSIPHGRLDWTYIAVLLDLRPNN